jgi:hypothetical protein
MKSKIDAFHAQGAAAPMQLEKWGGVRRCL